VVEYNVTGLQRDYWDLLRLKKKLKPKHTLHPKFVCDTLYGVQESASQEMPMPKEETTERLDDNVD